jgi:hypothetical protein
MIDYLSFALSLMRWWISNAHKIIINISVGTTMILALTSGRSSAESAAIESGRTIHTKFDRAMFRSPVYDTHTKLKSMY